MPVINVCSAGVSAPLSHGDIQRVVSQQHGEDSVTSIYLDQQLTVMAGSNEQWVGRVGDTGGGQYQVNIPHILGCWSMLEMGARTSSPSPCWPGNGDRRMLWATFASLK